MPERLEEGYRADLGHVHDVDDKTHEVVVEFPHEVLDSYRTDWGRGCFDESFGRRPPVMVFNHNPDLVIGSAAKAEGLREVSRIVGRFADFDEVPRARETFSLVRDGHMPGWSFHYRNGRSVAHPNIRGARRYVKADMLEFGPVTFPSIPGAKHVGIRSEEDTLTVPTLSEILELKASGLLADDGIRALLEEHYPNLREHIVIQPKAPDAPDPLAAVKEAITTAGVRHLVISVDHDGGISTAAPEDTRADTDDAATLAGAVDAALDSAQALLDGVDTSSLPDEVAQAVALVQAAGVAADELLAVMGVDDPDDDGGRSEEFSSRPWNFDAAAYTIEQLKRACLVVDGDGSTKDDCHLPVREPDGTLNRAAVHAAAGALAGARGGVNISAEDKKEAATKLVGLYKKLGEKPTPAILKLAGDGERSDDTSDLNAELRRVQERLSRR